MGYWSGGGRTPGTIDSGHAVVGDVGRDSMFQVPWKGWQFAEQVLRFFRGSLDKGFWERLGLMARILSVLWLEAGGEDRANVQVTGVHHAFAR